MRMIRDMFPSGFLDEFSFGCTYRQEQRDDRSWSLFRINDEEGDVRFSINIVPNENCVEMILPGRATEVKKVQKLKFKNVFPQSHSSANRWNRINFSVRPGNATLYLNCKEHSIQPIASRVEFNQNGDIWLAKYDDDFSTVPVSLM